jgi:hypothetical protein
MFSSFGGNVRHRQPCQVNGPSYIQMGYFRTRRYAKATEISCVLLDFMARRELLLSEHCPRVQALSVSGLCS